MRTRHCSFCSDPYQSEAKDDCSMPFCSNWCRKAYYMDPEELQDELDDMFYGDGESGTI